MSDHRIIKASLTKQIKSSSNFHANSNHARCFRHPKSTPSAPAFARCARSNASRYWPKRLTQNGQFETLFGGFLQSQYVNMSTCFKSLIIVIKKEKILVLNHVLVFHGFFENFKQVNCAARRWMDNKRTSHSIRSVSFYLRWRAKVKIWMIHGYVPNEWDLAHVCAGGVQSHILFNSSHLTHCNSGPEFWESYTICGRSDCVTYSRFTWTLYQTIETFRRHFCRNSLDAAQ